ncbi:MAG TPA: SRPBCC domain-containing protein, partial [Chitinophagaceae bacterium]|nr:SRPBCC domain-containing protein [Chitinophagaceae bacterium]
LITTWQAGSDIRFSTEWEGKIFDQWGKVLEIKPGELIRYTLFAPRPGLEDKAENYFIMNYVLTSVDNKTTLQIIQEDTRPGAVQEAPQGEENPILQALKKLAENYNDN